MTIDEATPATETGNSLTVTERVVAALWCEALQTAELPGTMDNFFTLGGDSMTMTMVEFRIKEELSVDLPAGSILAAPSLRELSALIDTSLPKSDSQVLVPSQGEW
jgi:phthiocerol/phenolphthiocerol synthesis type-I polyketide synthase E